MNIEPTVAHVYERASMQISNAPCSSRDDLRKLSNFRRLLWSLIFRSFKGDGKYHIADTLWLCETSTLTGLPSRSLTYLLINFELAFWGSWLHFTKQCHQIWYICETRPLETFCILPSLAEDAWKLAILKMLPAYIPVWWLYMQPRSGAPSSRVRRASVRVQHPEACFKDTWNAS